MTKQQTVELLQKQLPGFYSVEQVIEMINGIEDGGSFDEDKMDELKELIDTKVRTYLERMNGDDVVDFDSVELEMSGREVSVYGIDVNVDTILQEVNDGVDKAFEQFFQPKEVA